MIFQIRVLQQAADELREIYDWIQARSPEGAENWLEILKKAAERVIVDPSSYPTAPENEFVEFDVRHFFFNTRHGRKYRALFTIVGDEIRILHFRAAGQDLMSDPGPLDDES